MELGFMEIVVIALAIIVLFGPSKLPQIARDLGSGVRKMRGAMEDIKTEILKEADNPISEIKREIEKVKDAAKEYNPMEEVKREMDKVKEAAKGYNPMSQINKEVEELKNSVEGSTTSLDEKPKLKTSEDETYEGPVSR
ncbi:MAG: twin-arginine translocase TatA/TatE family subunit [Cruoricaptor ignavus]|nr:twin-arginine translocase TatA/TatE family subunit [Cruoricaptor ignavus]